MYMKVPLTKKAVLETMLDWLNNGNGGLDALDDTQLYQSFQTFVDNPPDTSEESALRTVWTDVQRTFKTRTMRPSPSKAAHPPPTPDPAASRRSRNASIREPPDLDSVSPEDLIEILDGMASATFSNVTEEVRQRWI